MDKLLSFLKDLYNKGHLRYVTCSCVTKTYNNNSIVPNHTLAYHTYMFDHTFGKSGVITSSSSSSTSNIQEYAECCMFDKTYKSLISSLSKYKEYENLFSYISSANITLLDFHHKIMQYKQYITDIDVLRAVVLKECTDNIPLIHACIQELNMNSITNNNLLDTYLAIIKQLNTSL